MTRKSHAGGTANSSYGLSHFEAASQSDTLIVTKPSIWKPGTTVKTIFVSAKPRKGYFNSLLDALAAADPYSRIELLPGKYFDNVVLTKPVEIGTEKGDEGSVELVSHGVTLTIDVDEAFIDSIVIRTNDTSAFAVSIESGCPIITRCTLASLQVLNSATPTVDDNLISGSEVHGIHVDHAAGGSYKQNTVEDHSWYCVCVESTGRPEFLHNKFTRGELGQVRVSGIAADGFDGASTSRRKTIISGNMKMVIDKSSQGGTMSVTSVQPFFKFNRIIDERKIVNLSRHHGEDDETPDDAEYTASTFIALNPNHCIGARKLRGIKPKANGDDTNVLRTQVLRFSVTDATEERKLEEERALLSESSMSFGHHGRVVPKTHQHRHAILVTHHANPTFVRESVINGMNVGFSFMQGAQGLVESCTIASNAGFGISIEGSSVPVVRSCTIQCNGQGGVKIVNAFPSIVGNELRDNRGPAVVMSGGCDRAQVTKNNVSMGAHPIGIHITNCGSGSVVENTIRDCVVGLRIDEDSVGFIEHNSITSCKVGAHISRSSKPTLTKNDFSFVLDVAVDVRSRACPTLTQNRVTASPIGLRVMDAQGDYDSNIFRENKRFNIQVIGSTGGVHTTPRFEDNTVELGRDVGVCICGIARPTFTSNHIHRNRNANIRLENACEAVIVDNTIEKSLHHGIVIGDDALGVVVGNKIHLNRGCGIIVQGRACPTIRGNAIESNGGAGISLSDSVGALVEKNRLEANEKSNIHIFGVTHNNYNNNNNNNEETTKHPDLKHLLHSTQQNETDEENGRSSGEVIQKHPTLIVIANWIIRGHGNGMIISDDAVFAQIIRNWFRDNAPVGIRVTSRSKPLLLGNLITGSHDLTLLKADAIDDVSNDHHALPSGTSTPQSRLLTVDIGRVPSPTLLDAISSGDFVTTPSMMQSMINQRRGAAKAVPSLLGAQQHPPKSTSPRKTAPPPPVSSGPTINTSIGLLCTDHAEPTVVDNTFENLHSGIQTRSMARPYAFSNEIVGCGVGVHSTLQGSGCFSENVLKENVLSGATLGNGSTCTFLKNVFLTNTGPALLVLDGVAAGSEICGNTFCTNESSGVEVRGRSPACVFEMNLFDAQPIGVLIAERGVAKFSNNVYLGHTEGDVVLDGEGADATFEAESFCGNFRTGIVVKNHARGVLRNMNFVGRSVGLTLMSYASPTIHACRFHDNATAVVVSSGAVGTFSYCIFNTNDVGIVLDGCSSKFHIHHCIFYHMNTTAMSIENNAAGMVEKCVFYHNICNAVQARTGATTRFEHCVLHSHTLDAIDLTGGKIHSVVEIHDAALTFKTCSMYNNAGYSIECFAKCDAIVQDSTFSKNNSPAVRCRGASRGAFTGNIFRDNLYGQILVEGADAHPTFEENMMVNSPGYGICCILDGCGEFNGNVISDCAAEGIIIESGANSTFNENEIKGCAAGGVVLRKKGRGVFTSNTILQNKASGVLVMGEGTDGTFKLNHVKKNLIIGIIVRDYAVGTFEGNEVYQNTVANISIRASSNPHFNDNIIYAAQPSAPNTDIDGCGVEILDDAQGLFVANIIKRNNSCGVYVARGSRPTLKQNMIVGERFAVRVDHANGDVLDNVISECRDAGIDMCNSTAHVEGNRIIFCGVGVHAHDRTHGKVTLNWILGCVDAGIVLGKGTDVNVFKNFVYGCASKPVVTHASSSMSKSTMKSVLDDTTTASNHQHHTQTGIFCADHACPRLELNLVSRCTTGVDIKHSSSPVLVSNLIAENHKVGVHITGHSRGELRENIICHNGNEGNIVVGERSATRFELNTVIGSRIGVDVLKSASPTFIGNDINSSALIGVRVAVGATPTFEKNSIHDIRGSGSIGLQDRGGCNVTGGSIWNCTTMGIDCAGEGCVSTFRGVEIRECGIGVMFSGPCTPTMSECSVSFSRSSNIVLAAEANPTIAGGNTSFRSKVALWCQEGSLGIIRGGNHFHFCSENVVLSGGGLFSENYVYDASSSGLIIRGPTVSSKVASNLCFDNGVNTCLIEGPGTKQCELVDNKFYFPKEDGAMVIRPESKVSLDRNLVRNTDAPSSWPTSQSTRGLANQNLMTGRDDKALALQFKTQRRARDRVARTVTQVEEVIRSVMDRCTRNGAQFGRVHRATSKTLSSTTTSNNNTLDGTMTLRGSALEDYTKEDLDKSHGITVENLVAAFSAAKDESDKHLRRTASMFGSGMLSGHHGDNNTSDATNQHTTTSSGLLGLANRATTPSNSNTNRGGGRTARISSRDSTAGPIPPPTSSRRASRTVDAAASLLSKSNTSATGGGARKSTVVGAQRPAPPALPRLPSSGRRGPTTKTTRAMSPKTPGSRQISGTTNNSSSTNSIATNARRRRASVAIETPTIATRTTTMASVDDTAQEDAFGFAVLSPTTPATTSTALDCDDDDKNSRRRSSSSSLKKTGAAFLPEI
eukprot:PhM_4_TR3628/c0_g1_i1/m.84213